MKLKLLIFIFAVAQLSFAGNTGSTVEKKKYSIASVDVLRQRALESRLSEDFLDKTKFLETFAGKELSRDELNQSFNTISNSLWNMAYEEMVQQMGRAKGAAAYYSMMPVMKGELNKEMAKIRPDLLKILLQDDHPELFVQLAEVENGSSNNNNNNNNNSAEGMIKE